MIAAMLSLTTLGLALGVLLGVAARVFKVEGNPLEAEILAMLPGSQCGQCGFAGCTPAAAAIAAGEAQVTVCPPGGRNLAVALAGKLGVSADLSDVSDKPPAYAHIVGSSCVGCTKCLKRCPTDAIIGASRQMHGVLVDACIGCEKCFEVCPNECIEMRPIEPTLQTWHWPIPADVT